MKGVCPRPRRPHRSSELPARRCADLYEPNKAETALTEPWRPAGWRLSSLEVAFMMVNGVEV